MSGLRHFTYQTRLVVTSEEDALLSAYAELFGRAERTLFARIRAGANPHAIKPAFMREFGLTARQYNAVRVGLEGKIRSVRERRPGLLLEAKARIAKARKVIARLEREAPGTNRLHQKKRRLATLEARREALDTDHAAGAVRLCFGSRKLFRAQFSLAENGFASHEAWREAWQTARRREFFVLGSRMESGGCQGCTATLDLEGTFALRLRLPDALGKHLVLSGVRFPYGHAPLLASVTTNRAVSYRFVRDAKGWRVFATTAVEAPPLVTSRQAGAVGVDVNADRLALAELDRHGNPVRVATVACETRGADRHQRLAVIGDAANEVAALAAAAGKPVVLERLDFARRKAELERVDPAAARVLSGFAYAAIGQLLRAACFRHGVEVLEVNPAYTSVIGAVNHAQRRGISVHQGAAVAVARRGLGLRESPAPRPALVPVRNGGHVALALPARNRAQHVWSQWAGIARKLKAAHAAHLRSGAHRLPPAPLPPATPGAGAIWGGPVRARPAKRPQHCSADVQDELPW